MPSAPPTHRPAHQPAPRERERQIDRERGSPRARGYDTRWDKARKQHLLSSPVCRYCELTGIVTAAHTVDHFWGHGPARAWFWVSDWWVSCCDTCHNSLKQSIERRGHASLTDLASRLGLSTPTR